MRVIAIGKRGSTLAFSAGVDALNTLCEKCSRGAQGETGHDALAYHLDGPYPGHRIFRCGECDERWIRHHGGEVRFGWTRYAAQMPLGIRQPMAVSPRP